MSSRGKDMGLRRMRSISAWRTLWSHALWLLLLLVMSPPMLEAAEGKRVAFVVGVGTYDKLADDKQLKNPVSDAEGISAKLSEIGYQVTAAPNVTRSAFNEQWQNVLDSLTGDDTFVLFFSGHGVQIEGENYLLPRDIPFIAYGRQAQLTREAISLNELLADLSTGDRPHPKNSVVILDACRDNPLIPPGYKSASTASGLANVPEANGIFVMYSAASNTTALDRLSSKDTNKYSVFTRTLLPLMGRTDLTIQELSTEVKNRVWKLAKSAQREQRPAYYDGILGEFCLAGCAPQASQDTTGFKESLALKVYPAQSKEFTGKDGAPMVLIPAGEFWMGSPDGEGEEDEHPRHHVALDAFYMDKFEITVARYAEFVRSGYSLKPEYWNQVDSRKHGNLPVVGVGWYEATAYCESVGKRLPTEAEWEKAARGTDGRRYPWGNDELTKRLANFGKDSSITNVYNERFSPVDSHEAGISPYGLHHMAGNVWEWTADWYAGDYYGKSQERNPRGASSGEYRVVRGGSWYNGPGSVRSANRNRYLPTIRSNDIGFRCAQDVPK